MPFNALDRRVMPRVFPGAMQQGVGILVRSAFLRGVLTNQVESIPEQLSPLRDAALKICAEAGQTAEGLSAIALRFNLSLSADLDHMAAGAAAGQLRYRATDLANLAPQIGEQHDLGERRRRKTLRQANALAAVVNDGLRQQFDDVAAAGRARQSRDADALAAFDQHLGERKRNDQRAIKLRIR